MAQRPNVIVFFTDQQRWDTTGVHGNPLDLTPNFDRMAMRGTHVRQLLHLPARLRARRAPACRPGSTPPTTGVLPQRHPASPQTLTTLAHYFGDAGYHTGYIGKWHLARAANPVPARPSAAATSTGSAPTCWSSPPTPTTRCSTTTTDRPVKLPGYRVDALTDAAIRYIDAHQARARSSCSSPTSSRTSRTTSTTTRRPTATASATPAAGCRPTWRPSAARRTSTSAATRAWSSASTRPRPAAATRSRASASPRTRSCSSPPTTAATSRRATASTSAPATRARSASRRRCAARASTAAAACASWSAWSTCRRRCSTPPACPCPRRCRAARSCRCCTAASAELAGGGLRPDQRGAGRPRRAHPALEVLRRRAPDKDGCKDAGSDRYVEEFLYDLQADPYELDQPDRPRVAQARRRDHAGAPDPAHGRRGRAAGGHRAAPARPSGQRRVSDAEARS